MGWNFEKIFWDSEGCLEWLPESSSILGNRSILPLSCHSLPSVLRYLHPSSLWSEGKLFGRHSSLWRICWGCSWLNNSHPWGYSRWWLGSQRLHTLSLDGGAGHRYVILILSRGMKSKSWKLALTHFSQRYKSASDIVEPNNYWTNKDKKAYATNHTIVCFDHLEIEANKAHLMPEYSRAISAAIPKDKSEW